MFKSLCLDESTEERDHAKTKKNGLQRGENPWDEDTNIGPSVFSRIQRSYPLVNVYIAMERSTIFNGKIHYKWPFSIAMFSSPEGIHRWFGQCTTLYFGVFLRMKCFFAGHCQAIFAYLYLTSTKIGPSCPTIAGWWFQSFFFSIVYGIILPIDELHHFSRWWNSTHQPDIDR